MAPHGMCYQSDAWDGRGELRERMTRAAESNSHGRHWGLEEAIAADRHEFGGSKSARAIKYLIADVILPGLGGHAITELLRR
jgi:hypothetical protein